MIELAQTTEDGLKLASVVAIVEVRSAIRRRQYAGDMSMKQAETAVRSLDEESRRMIQHPITSTIIELASALVDRQNLRALDSIQLATAISARNSLTTDSKIQFVSSDQKLLAAAMSEGFPVWDPIP